MRWTFSQYNVQAILVGSLGLSIFATATPARKSKVPSFRCPLPRRCFPYRHSMPRQMRYSRKP